MYKINHERDLPLAEEFRLGPIGHHSPNLQRILNILRYDLTGNQVVLITKVPFREWVLGNMPPRREDPITIDDNAAVFTNREDAEWAVFCARWKAATGHVISTPRSVPVIGDSSC